MTTDIKVIVDFDGIVAHATHDSNYYYTGCDSDVTYEGSCVNGTTLTLKQNSEYTLTLQAKAGNQCTVEGLHGFTDSDLVFSEDSNLNQLKFTASVKDVGGKDVHFEANFTDTNGNACSARWDPVIIVDVDPD